MSCLYKNNIKAQICGFALDTPNTKDGVIWYKIRVEINDTFWIIDRRYSDFEALHKKLVDSQGIPRDNMSLPPKKFIGNKDPDFVEKRRKLLNEYLKNIIQLLGASIPDDLAHFLNLYDCEIIFMLRKLAAEIFEKGENILAEKMPYTLSPYQIHAINERIKMPIPPLDSEDKRQDFSHVIEFCSRLGSLSIVGSNISLGKSNIVPNEYPMDLSVFKSLRVINLTLVNFEKIKEIGSVRQTVEKISICNCEFESINQLLLCDSLYKTFEKSGPKYIWTELSYLNCNNNVFKNVGDLGKLVPILKHLEFDFDKLQDVFSLTSLPKLETVSYRGNIISAPSDLHLCFGNVMILDMSQNQIQCLLTFQKLYSLVVLNLSSNKIEEVEQIKHVSKLPCLESLILTGNPVACAVDYRIKSLAFFGNRASALELDNEKANTTEMDQIAIIQALEIGKRGFGLVKS